MSVKQTIKESRAYFCLDCGKCTAVCPVSAHDESFSPRLTVYHTVTAQNGGHGDEELLNLCLTCGLCTTRCPAAVDYLGFTQKLRRELHADGGRFPCSHGGVLQNVMKILSGDGDGQRRLDWVPEEAKTAREGKLLYFTGCLAFYDAYFTHLSADTLRIAKDTLRVLNALGETPVLMENELCCGHDLYWSGDEEGATKLAEKNLAAIGETGAERVVTACPECAHTLRVTWAKLTGKSTPFEVLHLSEYLQEKMDAGDVRLTQREGTAVYHDSCRLARQLGETEAPRAALREVFGDGLGEMAHHGKNAICCGTNGWLHCNRTSQQIQKSRLEEAAQAGADTLSRPARSARFTFAAPRPAKWTIP